MIPKSKWRGVVLAALALVLAFSLAVPLTLQKAQEAEAMDLIWGLAEGMPALGLPAGAGAMTAVAEVPGTSTVFVLCDPTLSTPAVGVATVVLYRSDDGGLSWGTPIVIPIVAATEVGVDLEVSPNYRLDGTVFVLTNDPVGGNGRVYASRDKGITWPVLYRTVVTPATAQVNCLAIDPYFNSLLSGGTIAVGTLWVAPASTYYERWQSPVIGWSGLWTPVLSSGADAPDTLALKYAPTSAVRIMAVQWDPVTTTPYGITGAITTGFPLLAFGLPVPGVTSDGSMPLPWGIPFAAPTNAEIAIGSDYDPVSTPACANCPMHFFIGTDDGVANPNGSLYWFDPTLAAFVDLGATQPALHRDISGVVARGMYTRAELVVGCADIPITYKLDVRTQVWSVPVYIDGLGGPIGTISPTAVGVKLAYTGTGDRVHAITTQVPASAYGIAPAAAAGDLTCLSQSDNYGTSWWDTCLTQEDFRQVIQDQLWVSTLSGFVVTDTGTGIQSTFKCPMLGQWKRVDRWQGIQRITQSIDGLAIFLLDTGFTSGKVLRSTTGGDSFTPTATDPVVIPTIMMTCIAAGTADDIFVGDWNGHIYVTHTGGTSWTDSGQIASSIKSLDVPRFYTLIKHVLAGVDTLVGFNQAVLISKDNGATWASAGAAMWGGFGFGAAGHIEAKFSPMYNGVTENLVYAGLAGTLADNVYRADVSTVGLFTNMWVRGAATTVSNFEVVHVPGIVGDMLCKENIMYVLRAGTTQIYATYYPELVSQTVPLWRPDLVALGGVALWNLGGPTPGATNIPCPLDVVVAAGSPGAVTLFARDVSGALVILGWAPQVVANITETVAFLKPIAIVSPADGATVPSNNTATGEPVELQWPAVPGATAYDVMVLTDINNPATVVFQVGLIGAPSFFTEVSIPIGTLVDGQLYFWRTRISNTTGLNDHTGPWGKWTSFTVESVEMHKAPTLLSPTAGELGVALRPNFRWSVIQDITSTDFELATDPAFLNVIDTQTFTVQQTYGYGTDLDYNTKYYWRVKGHGGGTGIDAWTTPWTESLFTTMVVPPTPTPLPTAPPPVIITEETITPGWIWALIAIGGVLAVVVVVLIVRTRRPA